MRPPSVRSQEFRRVMPQQRFIALSGFSRNDFATEAIMTTDNGSDILCAIWQRQNGSSFSMEPDQIQKRFSRLQAELHDLKILGYALFPAMAILFAYWLVFTTQPIIT